MQAVRDRVEVSGQGPTWQVTAGTFDTALGFARERFEDPAVLARRDRGRWWPRVTLTVTTDPRLAATAPPLEDVSRPVVPVQRRPRVLRSHSRPEPDPLPASLEAIFAHQEKLRD